MSHDGGAPRGRPSYRKCSSVRQRPEELVLGGNLGLSTKFVGVETRCKGGGQVMDKTRKLRVLVKVGKQLKRGWE